MHNYAWLLAAFLVWKQQDNPPDDTPASARYYAHAGQLPPQPGNAANDTAEIALILLLIWHLACAKYHANQPGISSKTCKLTITAFFPQPARKPACLQAFPVSAPLLALCQIDHLPA